MLSVSSRYSPSHHQENISEVMRIFFISFMSNPIKCILLNRTPNELYIQPHRMKSLLFLAALASVGAGWQLRQAEEQDPLAMFVSIDMDGSRDVA